MSHTIIRTWSIKRGGSYKPEDGKVSRHNLGRKKHECENIAGGPKPHGFGAGVGYLKPIEHINFVCVFRSTTLPSRGTELHL